MILVNHTKMGYFGMILLQIQFTISFNFQIQFYSKMGYFGESIV